MNIQFNLMYHIPGLTDLGLEEKTREEWEWLHTRLLQQKEFEKPKK